MHCKRYAHLIVGDQSRERSDKVKSISDRIEEVLLSLIEEQDGSCQIVRNVMADKMKVTPSQITYVLSTRFTYEQGFLVESRRGGSGFVRIKRIPYSDASDYLMQLVRSMPESLTQHDVHILVTGMKNDDVITDGIAGIIVSTLSDRSLARLSNPLRDDVRSDICKTILTCLAAQGGRA
jgi:transcriptional regulator CtsR